MLKIKLSNLNAKWANFCPKLPAEGAPRTAALFGARHSPRPENRICCIKRKFSLLRSARNGVQVRDSYANTPGPAAPNGPPPPFVSNIKHNPLTRQDTLQFPLVSPLLYFFLMYTLRELCIHRSVARHCARPATPDRRDSRFNAIWFIFFLW